MAGSDDQARRSAARFSASGTPVRMNAVTSVSELIDSMGGRLSPSNFGNGAVSGAEATPPGSLFATGSAGGLPAASVFSVRSPASCLRRDQRLKKLSGSFIYDPPLSTDRAAPRRQDSHGRAFVSRMRARHGVPSQKPQWRPATVPASAATRQPVRRLPSCPRLQLDPQ